MKRGIAVGGNITVDYVKTVDSYPKQDNLSTILSITYALGGAFAQCSDRFIKNG